MVCWMWFPLGPLGILLVAGMHTGTSDTVSKVPVRYLMYGRQVAIVGQCGVPLWRHYIAYVLAAARTSSGRVLVESAKAGLALGGYETPILAMRYPSEILYYR
jgi:hypothetical protein